MIEFFESDSAAVMTDAIQSLILMVIVVWMLVHTRRHP